MNTNESEALSVLFPVLLDLVIRPRPTGFQTLEWSTIGT